MSMNQVDEIVSIVCTLVLIAGMFTLLPVVLEMLWKTLNTCWDAVEKTQEWVMRKNTERKIRNWKRGNMNKRWWK